MFLPILGRGPRSALAVQDNPSEGRRECYGSIYTPTNIGARGYLLNNDETIGVGAIRLVVNGTLTVNGTVAADAESAIAGPAGGAGGGGEDGRIGGERVSCPFGI